MPLFNYAQWDTLTSGISNNLFDVAFVNETRGYAVGSGGKILLTTDGGANWTDVSTAHTAALTAVVAITADTAYTSGNATGAIFNKKAKFITSVDTGNTWTINSPTTLDINVFSMFFVGPSEGYAVGNIPNEAACVGFCSIPIRKTVDGGTTWSTLASYYHYNETAVEVSGNDIFFTNKNNGFVVGTSGLIIKTTDAGADWTDISSEKVNRDSTTYMGIHFCNDNFGYIVGNSGAKGIILKTSDAGDNWDTLTIPTKLTEVYCINTIQAYAIGDSGKIYSTVNGGISWNEEIAPVNTTLNAITIVDTTAYIVGLSGVILKSNITIIYPPFNVSFTTPSNDTICEGRIVDFTNTSTGTDGYEWFVNGVSVGENVNFSNEFDIAGSFEVKLKGDSAGISYDSMMATITVLANPVASFLISADTINQGESVTFTNTSTDAVSYSWEINGTEFLTTTDASYQFSDTGVFFISLVASNSSICSDQAVKTIYVRDTVSITGIDEHNIFSGLLVYPNPNKGLFNISFEVEKKSNVNIDVVDILGANLYHDQYVNYTGKYSKQINLESTEGVYFLKIQIGDMIIYKKLIYSID